MELIYTSFVAYRNPFVHGGLVENFPWRDVLLNPSAGFDSQSIRNRFDAACSQNLSLILSYPLNLPYLISPLSLSLFRPSETFVPRVKVYMIELLTDLSLVESLRGSMKNNFSI